MIFSWNTLFWLMLALYLPACAALIGVVLLQKGKGVGFQGAFGAGTGAETVFGPRTSRSLPQRITYTMAGVFMVLALALSLISGRVGRGAAPELLDETAVPEAAQSEELNELFEGEAAAAAGATPATEIPAADAPPAGAPDAATTTPVTVTPSVDENMVTIPAAPDGAAVVAPSPTGDTPEATPAPETAPQPVPVSIPLDASTPTETVVPPPAALGDEAALPTADAPTEEAPAEDAQQ